MNVTDTIRRRLEDGLRHHQSGRFDQAGTIYRNVLEDDPNNPDALHFLGLIAHQQGDFEVAIERISRAVEGDPDRPTFQFNLGAAHLAAGHKMKALSAYQQAADLKPDWPEAHYNAGSLQGQLGDLESARGALETALHLKSDYAEASSSLSAVFNLLMLPNEAKTTAERAIEINPKLAEAWTNLGNAEDKLGNLDAAEMAHLRSIEINPGYAGGYYNLGNTYADLWRQSEAIAQFRKALEIDPGYAPAQDNLLLNLLYDQETTEESFFRESLNWEETLPTSPQGRAFRNDPDPNRRLRVGYVSPDFRTHSCAYFLEPLFRDHDRMNVDVFAYSNVAQPDDATLRFQKLSDHWRDISRLSDEEACRLIESDQIDILIDLAGRSKNHRLEIFRHKPSPVQASWLGYPGTTGIDEIGYRLTDGIADPKDTSDKYHTETLIRLDHGFHCYAPSADSPPAMPASSRHNKYVTFGSFNNLSKVTQETIATWSNILDQVPQSVLVLKSRMLDIPQSRERLLSAFQDAGIDTNRINCLGWIPRVESPLAAYHQIDIALDTFPYNGTTTTFEALWMGVPVITLKGSQHAGRVGASILQGLELEDFVATSPEQYVEIAKRLAESEDELEEHHTRLRPRLQSSPFMDGPGFARRVEAAFRQMWREWCQASE